MNLQDKLKIWDENKQEVERINTEKQLNRDATTDNDTIKTTAITHKTFPFCSQNTVTKNLAESKKRRREIVSESISESSGEYSMQNSSESSTLDFTEYESEFPDKHNLQDSAARSFARLIPFKVTKQDIEFQEFLLAAMKHSYESEAKTDRNNKKTFEIPAHMLNPGNNLIEISPNSRFYLPRDKVAYIELKSTKENHECDWKLLVRETLLEVYGESITNYSAIGKRGARPAINAVLFKALFNWATEKAGKPITRKAYVQCINKYASNKRKYRNKKKYPAQHSEKRSKTAKN